MDRLFLLALALMIAFGSICSASAQGDGNACPGGFAQIAAAVPASKDDFIKTYMALNLAFPQHNETINAGITSFFFARSIAYKDIYGRFSDQQWDQIFTAMTRTHAAHGIGRKVTVNQMQNTLSGFITNFPRHVEWTVDFMVHPDLYPGNIRGAEAKVEWFFAQPQFADRAAKLRGYAQTVQSALRSPEARDISSRFRETIGGKSALPDSEKISVTQIAKKVEETVVAKLIAAHPELGEMVTTAVGRNYNPAKSRATILYEAMRGPY